MNSFNCNFPDITSRGKIAFVQSCWHREIVDALRDSFLQVHANLDSRDVDLFEVPGAFRDSTARQASCLQRSIRGHCRGRADCRWGYLSPRICLYRGDRWVNACPVGYRRAGIFRRADTTGFLERESARIFPRALCHQGRRGGLRLCGDHWRFANSIKVA